MKQITTLAGIQPVWPGRLHNNYRTARSCRSGRRLSLNASLKPRQQHFPLRNGLAKGSGIEFSLRIWVLSAGQIKTASSKKLAPAPEKEHRRSFSANKKLFGIVHKPFTKPHIYPLLFRTIPLSCLNVFLAYHFTSL